MERAPSGRSRHGTNRCEPCLAVPNDVQVQVILQRLNHPTAKDDLRMGGAKERRVRANNSQVKRHVTVSIRQGGRSFAPGSFAWTMRSTLFLVTVHHIVADGLSRSAFWTQELLDALRLPLTRHGLPTPKHWQSSARDFALAKKRGEWLVRKDLNDQIAY